METTSRTSSQKEGKKKGSSEANLIEERSQILNAVNESFKRKIARANKKYEEEEATSSKEESSVEETVNTSKRRQNGLFQLQNSHEKGYLGCRKCSI